MSAAAKGAKSDIFQYANNSQRVKELDALLSEYPESETAGLGIKATKITYLLSKGWVPDGQAGDVEGPVEPEGEGAAAEGGAAAAGAPLYERALGFVGDAVSATMAPAPIPGAAERAAAAAQRGEDALAADIAKTSAEQVAIVADAEKEQSERSEKSYGGIIADVKKGVDTTEAFIDFAAESAVACINADGTINRVRFRILTNRTARYFATLLAKEDPNIGEFPHVITILFYTLWSTIRLSDVYERAGAKEGVASVHSDGAASVRTEVTSRVLGAFDRVGYSKNSIPAKFNDWILKDGKIYELSHLFAIRFLQKLKESRKVSDRLVHTIGHNLVTEVANIQSVGILRYLFLPDVQNAQAYLAVSLNDVTRATELEVAKEVAAREFRGKIVSALADGFGDFVEQVQRGVELGAAGSLPSQYGEAIGSQSLSLGADEEDEEMDLMDLDPSKIHIFPWEAAEQAASAAAEPDRDRPEVAAAAPAPAPAPPAPQSRRDEDGDEGEAAPQTAGRRKRKTHRRSKQGNNKARRVSKRARRSQRARKTRRTRK